MSKFDVGSSVRYTIGGANKVGFGRIVAVVENMIQLERLVPMEVNSDDVRLLHVPHLCLLVNQFVDILVSDHSETFVQAVLVANASCFLRNVIIFREGMVNIYAVSSQTVNGTTTTISHDAFPCSLLRTADFSNNDVSSLLKSTRADSGIEHCFDIYVFRHTLAEHIQHALKSGRGRVTSGRFHLHTTPDLVTDLYELLTHQGHMVSTKTGVNRATRVVRTNIIQPIRVPKQVLHVALSDPLALSGYLGSHFHEYPIVPPHFTVGVLHGYQYAHIPTGNNAIVFQYDLNTRTLFVHFKVSVA